jgi:putative phosphoribosyl transferase
LRPRPACYDVFELNTYALARLGGPKAPEIIPKAGHLFAEPGAMDAVIRQAAAWFERYLDTRLETGARLDGTTMPFSDRRDAGRQLAAALTHYRAKHAVVLALPRGGVPVAAEIAIALNAPLDLVLVRKIGVPYQPELAMGAVAEAGDPLVVRNDEVIALAGIEESEFMAVRDAELAEIERRRKRYLGQRQRADVAGRIAIVVDDGIATGATTRAALRATRLRKPKELVLAVPVAPTEALAAMREEADHVVCLEEYESFGAIGLYYSDFRQISDQEVIETLARFRPIAYSD